MWSWFILFTVWGGCVGSFLNVVIYRLPEGKSIVTPPSSCPKCGHRLSWYDNVPVLGWLWLGGRCRYCKAPISVQYPLVEALCAGLFAGLFAVYYWSGWRSEWFAAGLADSWPVFVVHLVLLASLLAATLIDAKLYIIPLEIPWAATVVAAIGLPASAWWIPASVATCPWLDGSWSGVALGGLVGLSMSVALLRWGVLPQSFAEEPQEQAAGVPWPVHPHPRREVLKEALFLLPVAVGAAAGYLLWPSQPDTPAPLGVLAGVVMGYLVGGGIVWAIRILGTLGFGKEAMGLGDVHLLAAVGAVLGAVDVTVAFFLAPFFGLLAAVVLIGVSKLGRGRVRVIPYGPYLAMASVLMMAGREPILRFLGIL